MSRSYKISIKNSVIKTVCVDDEVTTDLEILEVLPKEDMKGILTKELEKKGYNKSDEDGIMVKEEEDGVVIIVDINKGTATVSNKASKTMCEEDVVEGTTYNPNDPKIKEQLKEKALKNAEEKVEQKKQELQNKITKDLENKLNDISQELNEAINRATGNALKQKAASMGTIKELSEDEKTGNLTIVVEV